VSRPGLREVDTELSRRPVSAPLRRSDRAWSTLSIDTQVCALRRPGMDLRFYPRAVSISRMADLQAADPATFTPGVVEGERQTVSLQPWQTLGSASITASPARSSTLVLAVKPPTPEGMGFL
jgi:hypothetical protein